MANGLNTQLVSSFLQTLLRFAFQAFETHTQGASDAAIDKEVKAPGTIGYHLAAATAHLNKAHKLSTGDPLAIVHGVEVPKGLRDATSS